MAVIAGNTFSFFKFLKTLPQKDISFVFKTIFMNRLT